jgi:hypothetical protein
VVAIVTSFEGLLGEAFDQFRGSAEVNVAILARMLGALNTIGNLTISPGSARKAAVGGARNAGKSVCIVRRGSEGIAL